MKQISLFAKLVLLLAALMLSSLAWASTISGTVFGSGNPLSGVTVSATMQGAERPAASAVTDQLGRYSLALAEQGLYNLLVSPPIDSGFANSVVNDVLLGSSPVVQNVVLISGASLLSGTVRDGKGGRSVMLG